MVLEWLRSERHMPGARTIANDLLDQPNLTNADENRQRLEALRIYRAPIIDPLPADVESSLATIEAIDLDKLYIVPTFDWFLDTGGNFRLTDTAANLKPGRGYLSPYGPQAITHYHDVMSKRKYLSDYDATTTDELLILIAANDAGPYTIIDGTHRATALYINQLEDPNLPWRAILLSDPRMANRLRHIESPQAQNAIRTNAVLASAGSLW